MNGGYDMLLVPAPQGVFGALLLCAAAGEVSLDPAHCKEHPDLPRGWKGRVWQKQGIAPLRVKEWNHAHTIRILEARSYEWALIGGSADAVIKSSLEAADKQRWTVRRRPEIAPEGSFTVVNHLGHARLEVIDGGIAGVTALLEVCSVKMDYDQEYRAMTEDIAEFCTALLMRWQAPTGLRFTSNPQQHARTLMEKFFFLRHCMAEEKVQSMMGMVVRNPHRHLITEREWKPAAHAASTLFLTDPSRFADDWQRGANSKLFPSLVVDERKEETLDTEPNRFLLHAIESFLQLCEEVEKACGAESPVGMEASLLRECLAGTAAQPFFRDVGRMRRLPLENQTLQKRAGYRDFLRAWILCEAASTVDWVGLEDSHYGDSRDVAKLYEYWVFLKLNRILENLPGMSEDEEDRIDPLAFIGQAEDGCMEIRLKSGKHSKRSFRYHHGTSDLIVELHYEREFRNNTHMHGAGSYSRQFRPDYTLAIRPASYPDEPTALSMGKSAFLHFDAKYRLEQFTQILGEEQMDEKEMMSEKTVEKTIGTSKRADLLKMHTYNDAVRMTIGSYVLYPGDSSKSLQRFHEIAPGVGAYAMKPGNEACLDALGTFILDILKHQSDRFTQYRYLADHQHSTTANVPKSIGAGESAYHVACPGSSCVMVWMEADRERFFRQNGFAYSHAIPENNGRRLEVEISVEVGAELIPYGGGRGTVLTTKDWRAKIRAAKFLTRERLCDYLQGKVPDGWRMPSSASHYFLFEFEEVAPFTRINISNLASMQQQGSRFMAFTCEWRDLIAAGGLSREMLSEI